MLNPFTKDRYIIEAMEAATLESPDEFTPERSAGISKYRATLGRGAQLEALLINQESDTLLVSCHGALRRKDVTLPRFERRHSFQDTGYSSMFFGDPTLHLHDELTLGWYTGWEECDPSPVIAKWVQKAASAIGATKIVFLGSSGGGFASLHISTYVPGSFAVPLSPQTRLSKYRPGGSYWHQQDYLSKVMPHLIPKGGLEEVTDGSDWDAPLGERASAIERYGRLQQNYVLYVQNANDVSHHDEHYLPFRASVESGPNRDRVRFHVYDGPEGHHPPTREQMDGIIDTALTWAHEVR